MYATSATKNIFVYLSNKIGGRLKKIMRAFGISKSSAGK
jgi:hypothetical protein